MNRTSTYLATLVGVICVYFLARLIFFPYPRIVRNDVVQGILIPYNANESRNNVRLPSYNRLDISFRLEGKSSKRGKERKNHDYWVFSVYNLYARKNPFSIYFAQTDQRTPAGQPIPSQASQLSIIGTLVPAISYNFKF